LRVDPAPRYSLESFYPSPIEDSEYKAFIEYVSQVPPSASKNGISATVLTLLWNAPVPKLSRTMFEDPVLK
jgi:hypothetical protein